MLKSITKPRAVVLHHSLIRHTLIRIGLGIAVVFLFVTVIGYVGIKNYATRYQMEQTETFSRAQIKEIESAFQAAEDQQQTLARNLSIQFDDPTPSQADVLFRSLMQLDSDGAWRTPLLGFDANNKSSLFMSIETPVTSRTVQQVLTIETLLNQFGPVSKNRFESTWVQLSNGIVGMYAPNYAGYVQNMSPRVEAEKEPWFVVAMPAHNPAKVMVWTDLYFDPQAAQWMISAVSPIYQNNKFIGVVGNDLAISGFLNRAIQQKLPDTYNFIIRQDSKIINHPQLNLSQADAKIDPKLEPSLNLIHEKLKIGIEGTQIIEAAQNNYLIVMPIAKTNWYYVSVLPKNIINKQAQTLFAYILAAALIVVLSVLTLVYITLRQQITSPLMRLIRATTALTHGQAEVTLDTRRQDEIGKLNQAFASMLNVVRERDEELTAHNRDLEKKINDRTRTLHELVEQLRASEKRAIESESYLRAIISTAADAILTLDQDGRVQSFNPAAELMFGYSEAEIIGQTIDKLLPPQTEPVNGDDKTPYARRKYGALFPIELNISEFEVGENDMYTWIVRDITERKQHELEIIKHRDHLQELVQEQTQDIIQAKEAAEAANSAKSHFLANMSHELRTPMHAILSYSDYGLQKLKPEYLDKLEKYFTQIHQSGERLLLLINDLLDLAKLEADKMTYHFEKQNLLSIAQQTSVELGGLFAKRNQNIQIIEPNFVCIAEVDAMRISQVMHNLLSNAYKFTPEGGDIKISFTNNRLERDSGKKVAALSVNITDSGLGIPEDELDSVFDKFIQSSKTRTKAGGTGLGLAICQQIVIDHGGEILAHNNPNQGATFTFTLPISHNPT